MPQPLVGPAALNAVDEDRLRQLITSVVQQEPTRGPCGPRPPLLAPFITNELLRLVNNILAPLDDAERGGWGLQSLLGRAVAALTGAPPPASMEDARHWGNGIQSRVSDYAVRLKTVHTWNARRSKVGKARFKEDQQALYVCRFGGTPPRPCEEVLVAPLAPQPQPPPLGFANPVPLQEGVYSGS